ncbi:MAG: hypothetical protein K6G38_05255, partial [Gammaproteobacteria bacterium]|nr:hypothetical protein [Gammaproteobacteria bacterium]
MILLICNKKNYLLVGKNMSHLHYIYQYELVATIVCFACMISLLLRNRLNNVKSIVFFILLTATFFAGLLDTISCILINELYQGELNPKLLPLIKTLQTGYLIALNFTPYLWFLYVTSSIGRRKINIKYILIMLIPFLVSLGLIIGNIWLDFIYYVDGNEYLSGPALYVLYVISAGYILYTLFEIIRFRKMLRKTQTIFGISYIVTTILSTISEAVAPTYLIELFVISFHLLLMTINFETESDLREPVTGLYNKTTFMLLSERAYKYGFEREVIIIKLNHIHHLKTTIGIKKYNATLRSIANYLLGFKECFIFDCENGCFLLSFEK